MTKRTYKKLDALTCEIVETSTSKKNFNVEGILAREKQLVEQLEVVRDVIAGMKKEGCIFESIAIQKKK